MSDSSDLIDRAGVVEQEFRDRSVFDVVSKLKGPIEVFCEECGDEIPMARREACAKQNMKATHCVPCLTLLERRGLA